MIIEFGKNNKQFKICETLELTKSSQNVEYSDLTIDFSDGTIEDLPFYLQEIRIKEDNGILVYTGFLNDYTLPELRIDDIDRELKISLFSPRELATKKFITINRTAMIIDIIKQILDPLLQDGFIIKELNVENKSLTLQIISRSIEETMNYLCNKKSLFWDINEKKEIIVNEIDYQFNKPAIKKINTKNCYKEIKGFESLTPKVENSDYANIINIKNARVFYELKQNVNIILKDNDRIEFENPVDISLATAERISPIDILNGGIVITNNLVINYNDNQNAYIISGFNINSGEIKNGSNLKNIGTDDKNNDLFVLNMNPTFKNLAESVTYKGEQEITINYIESQTALQYATMKLINWNEINKLEGVITPSGQIEKVVDVKSGWFTEDELIEYIRSLFNNNNKETKTIIINADNPNNLQVGDKIDINIPECYTVGTFIIIKIDASYSEYDNDNYVFTLQNTGLTENYIDIFRKSLDIEEDSTQTQKEYIVEYAEEDIIKENHEIKFENEVE